MFADGSKKLRGMFMKKIIRGFAIGLIFSAVFASCAKRDVSFLMSTIGKPELVHLSSMFNEKNGISIGADGTVTWTCDGGQKWEKGHNKSACLFAMECLNEKNCVAGGNRNCLVRTTDGGQTWTSYPPVPAFRIKSVSFKSFEKGWIASKAAIYETTDEGRTWTAIPRPKEIQLVETIYMIDCGKGFVCSSDGSIYITEDKGATWNSCGNILSSYESTFAIKQNQSLQQMAMTFKDDIGYIECFGKNEKDAPVLKTFKSFDKGNTWQESSTTPLEKLPVGVNICMANNVSLTNVDSTACVYKLN